MILTAFSFTTAIIWCNIYIIMIAALRKNNRFIVHYSILPLMVLVGFCAARLIFVFELPIAIPVQSILVFPAIASFLTTPHKWLLNTNLLSIFIFTWLLGTIFILAKYVIAAIRIKKQLALHTEDITFSPNVSYCLNKLGTSSPICVLKSPRVSVPIATGYICPKIILPDWDFTREEMYHILLHEYTHLKLKDIWFKTAMFLLCAIFWWNPFVYLLRKSFDHILEIRCDLYGTKHFSDTDKVKYLSSITKVVKLNLAQNTGVTAIDNCNVAALVSTQNEHKLVQRFNLVLKNNVKKRNAPTLCFIYLMFFATFFTSHLFVLQPATPAPNTSGTFTVSPENAYLVENTNNTHSLYVDGKYLGDLKYIDEPPFSDLYVKENN